MNLREKLKIWLESWKEGIIAINDLGYVTLNDKYDEVKLKDLLCEIFVRKASVSHIESFLTKILVYIDGYAS